jgi:hypothetical protein
MQSEQVNELAKALAGLQKVLPKIRKSGTNPHFRSSYSKFEDMRDATSSVLPDWGLAVTQSMQFSSAGDHILVTTLLHESGQWIKSQLKLCVDGPNMQKLGSAITYGRRYSYAAILGIADTDEDDDGEAAVSRPSKPAGKKPMLNEDAAGSYVITMGKYKGVSINAVAEADMENYVKWLKSQGELKGPGLELAKHAVEYYGWKK